IRDKLVTGVQTCALPIWVLKQTVFLIALGAEGQLEGVLALGLQRLALRKRVRIGAGPQQLDLLVQRVRGPEGRPELVGRRIEERSEERRVGKEGRYGWSG